MAEAEAKELAEAVGRFLSTVPYTERRVFLMRYFNRAKIQDIAIEFNMSTGKVKPMSEIAERRANHFDQPLFLNLNVLKTY